MVQNSQLTADIWLYDYLQSNTAERFPLVKEQQFNPSEQTVNNLIRFAVEVDQPCHDLAKSELGASWNRTSTHRCPDFIDQQGKHQLGLNSLVHGSPTSAHIPGRAGDRELYINGKELDGTGYKAFCQALVASKIPFDKLILEYGTEKCPAWLHLQINVIPGIARRQVLRIWAGTGGVYLPFDINKWNV